MTIKIKFILFILIILFSCTNKSPQEKNKISSNKSTPNLENLDNNQREIYHHNIRNELINDLASYNYDGKSVSEIIHDHIIELYVQNKLGRISNPVRLVRSNVEAYDEFLVPEDLILYDDILAMKIDSLHKNDIDFRKQLIRDKLNEYYNHTLITKLKQEGLNTEQNPQLYATAFAVYNRFGSEALMYYINIYLHYPDDYIPNAPPTYTQDNRVISALRHFMRNYEYKEINPLEYAEEFLRYMK